jgi:hypothetical protein
MEKIWNKFIDSINQIDPEFLRKINPPATEELLNNAKTMLGPAFHEDVEQLYSLANGFADGAYLLTDYYRILPIDEMIAKSLALIGKRFTTDYEAGESMKTKKGELIILALVEEDDCDKEKIGVSVTTGKTDMAIWFKEGGIHDYKELIIDSSQTLEKWLTSLIDGYYTSTKIKKLKKENNK